MIRKSIYGLIVLLLASGCIGPYRAYKRQKQDDRCEIIADQRVERARKEALVAREEKAEKKKEHEEDKKQTFQDIRELIAWVIVVLGGGTGVATIKKKKIGRCDVK